MEKPKFTAWMPEKAEDKDMDSHIHIFVTEKDKFKEKKAARVFFTEDRRFLFEEGRSYRMSESEDRAIREVLLPKRKELIEVWERINGEVVYK